MENMHESEFQMRRLGFSNYIEFIKKSHGDQKRIDGSPYYYHPISVMKIGHSWLIEASSFDPFIISNWKKENNLSTWSNYDIIQSFVYFLGGHDLFEDTEISPEDYEKEYGFFARKCIELVTKPKICENITKEKKSFDAYAKIGNATEIVKWGKLADRYHNLSEMRHASRQFRERYLKDTQMLLSLINMPATSYPMVKTISKYLEECRSFYYGCVEHE